MKIFYEPRKLPADWMAILLLRVLRKTADAAVNMYDQVSRTIGFVNTAVTSILSHREPLSTATTTGFTFRTRYR